MIARNVNMQSQLIENLLDLPRIVTGKLTTPRGGRVHVSLRRINSHAEIVVSDTGPGIPAALLPVIVDRFRQADSSSRRAHGGLGIGLALSAISPRCTVARSRRTGSAFTVKLPLPIHAGAQTDTRVHPRAGGAVARPTASTAEALAVLDTWEPVEPAELIAVITSLVRRNAR